MARSVAIIGAGQIGYAAAEAFLSRGWDVCVYARTAPPWKFNGQTFQHYIAGDHPAPSADCIVDTIAYDAEHVARYDPDRSDRLIAVSSASVYIDHTGRTLDEAADTGFPELQGAITEEQMTVRPGPQTYSTRKVRMEQTATARFGSRATILRPCAVYGPWSRHPREWWFVKRIKDRRTIIPLAFEGKSTFHTTSAASIGSLAVHLAGREHGGIFNIADDLAMDVKSIGDSVREVFGKRIRFYLMESPPLGSVGRTPWSVPLPFTIDCGKACDSGFNDFDVYHSAVDQTVGWLRDQRFDDWRTAFPQLAAYPWDLFNYEAEDRFLASL